MQYTVSSRGRPIGTAEIHGFRFYPLFCHGDFHPNAEGERLMPVIDALLPALLACTSREARREREVGRDQAHDQSSPRPLTPLDAASLADLSAVLERLESLDLALQREDGSIVPTESIGIRSTQQMMALYTAEMEEAEARGWAPDDDDDVIDWEAELARGDEPGDVFDDAFDAAPEGASDEVPPWLAELDEARRTGFTLEGAEPCTSGLPRYGITVELLDPDAIP